MFKNYTHDNANTLGATGNLLNVTIGIYYLKRVWTSRSIISIMIILKSQMHNHSKLPSFLKDEIRIIVLHVGFVWLEYEFTVR